MYNTKEYKVTKTGGASSRTYILEYIGNQSIVIGSARLTITLATKECEIKNIQISKEYQGLGYSYRILEAVKDYIESTYQDIICRITFESPLSNKGIRRSAKKAGYCIEGIKRFVYDSKSNTFCDIVCYGLVVSNSMIDTNQIYHRHSDLYDYRIKDLVCRVLTMDSWQDVEESLKECMNIITDGTEENKLGKEVYEDLLKEVKAFDDSKSESYASGLYNQEPVKISELMRELDRCDPSGYVYLRIDNDDLAFNYTTPLSGILPCSKANSAIGGVNVEIMGNMDKVNKFASCVLY